MIWRSLTTTITRFIRSKLQQWTRISRTPQPRPRRRRKLLLRQRPKPQQRRQQPQRRRRSRQRLNPARPLQKQRDRRSRLPRFVLTSEEQNGKSAQTNRAI